MNQPTCLKCGSRLVRVETRTQWSPHLGCIECRTVYVSGWSQVSICTSPREHVLAWPVVELNAGTLRPPIISGPMCRGLL